LDEDGRTFSEVMDFLKEMHQRDFQFSDGHVLGSMYTTPHEIAKKAYSLFWEANLGNPGLYPGTSKLQKEVVNILGGLTNGSNLAGYMVGGGTEANITSLWVAKKLSGSDEVIFPKSAHFSFYKACDLMGLKPVVVDLNDNFQMDMGLMEEKLSDRTAAVVGIAGTTELGVVDPISEISELCEARNTYFHVDAAFGGFVLPFLKELGYDSPPFDFSLPGVSSLTVDPHKMGMATIPSGVLLIRKKEYLSNIAIESPYLTHIRQSALAGTRNSASVAATYAVLKHLGRNGYKDIVRHCMEMTMYLKRSIEEMGLTLVTKPTMNIIGINFKDAPKVEKEMDSKGWKLSKAKHPCCLRLVIMPHVTPKIADEFIGDLEGVSRELGEI